MKKTIILISAIFVLSAFMVLGAECTDSDGGRNTELQGVVSVGDNPTTNKDNCFDRWTVYEYSCENGEIKGEKIECQYGCSAGQCNNYGSGKETVKTQCTDSDPADNPYVVGSVSGGDWGSKILRDYCINTRTVFEYNCEGGKEIACEGVCERGQCHERGRFPAEQEECIDNDGNNFFFQSSVVHATKDSRDVLNDYCADKDYLIEQTCEGPLKVKCSRSCTQGSCTGEVVPLEGELVESTTLPAPQTLPTPQQAVREVEEAAVVDEGAQEAEAQAEAQQQEAATKKSKTWLWVVIVVLVIAILYYSSGDKKKKKK